MCADFSIDMPISVETPYGAPNVYSIWVTAGGLEYNMSPKMLQHSVLKRKNKIWTGSFTFRGLTATERADIVKVGNVFKYFAENKLLFVGVFENVNYKSTLITECFSKDRVAAKLLNTITGSRTEYTNQSNTSLFTTLLSGTGVTAGTNESYGNLSVRTEYSPIWNTIVQLADQSDFDFWPSWGNYPYNSLILNQATRKGSTTSLMAFTRTGTGANLIECTREPDRDNVINSVTCYDDKTEVLTETGFKLFKDLQYSDKIATLNPQNFELEYHCPIAMQKFQFKGNLHEYKSKQVNLAVTPDHRVFCKKLRQPFSVYESKEVFGKWLEFKKDCVWKGKRVEEFTLSEIKSEWTSEDNYRGHRKRKHSLVYPEKKMPMDQWLELLGWYLTEGNLHKNTSAGYKIRITQNYPKLNLIIDLLRKLDYKFYVCKNPDRVEFYDKQLYLYLKGFGKSGDKFVPQYVKNLPTDQIKIFLNILFNGDGHIENGKWVSYYSKSKRLIDDVAELLLKVGFGCKVYNRSNRKGNLELSVNHNELTPIVKPKYQKLHPYDGFVYDITVPNHILFVRREGVSLWSGNCLAYGDGVNQLRSENWHATAKRTLLDGSLTAAATTVTVDSTALFSASGRVRIGQEIIAYTGKTATTFTGCTRGSNDSVGTATTAYAHDNDIEVYQYYDGTTFLTANEDNAETGSSIKTNTLISTTVQKREVVDQNSLDRIAQRLITTFKNPVERITIRPAKPKEVLNDLDVGDTITVEDTLSGLTGTYEIVGFQIGSDTNGVEKLLLEISNHPLELFEQVSISKDKVEKEATFMQGATNIYNIQVYENCDDAKPLNMRFFYPSEIIKLNAAKLSFKIKDFRHYNNPSSKAATDDLVGSASYSSGSWTTVSSITLASTDVTSAVHVSGWLRNDSGGTNDYNIRLRYSDDTGHYPNTSGQLLDNVPNTEPGFYSIMYPGEHSGKTLNFQIKPVTTGTVGNISSLWSPIQAIGIAEVTVSSPSVTVKMGEDGSTLTEISGSPFTANVTENDLVDELNVIGTNKWIDLEFTPNKKMRIEANLYLQTFIKSV